MNEGPYRAVVAAQADDGSVVYEYGLAGEVTMDMEADEVVDMSGRRRTRSRWSTTIAWAQPPRRSATYPTDADFDQPAEIDAAQRALGRATPQVQS